MNKVTLKDKTFKTFIPYERIMEAIDDVAARINEDFKGCQDLPILLCVLNGSIMFTAELMKRLDFNCQIVSTKLSSYEGTNTTGEVKQVIGLSENVEGKDIIIIEDIVDTGLTAVKMIDDLRKLNPASIRFATLLHKQESSKTGFVPDYIAFSIPPLFVVGYGLDLDGKARNLPEIYINCDEE